MTHNTVDPSAVAAAARETRVLSGRIIYRQIVDVRAAFLWEPTRTPARWSRGFPALYTSLNLDVALAERIKRLLDRPVRLVVGVAEVTIARVFDLQAAGMRSRLGLREEDLVTEDYALTQEFGWHLYRQGVAALLVPAAIAATAAEYPRFRLLRDKRAETHTTPSEGANLVIYPDNLARGDAYREVERFTCIVQGLPA